MTVSATQENNVAILAFEGNLLGEVDNRPLMEHYEKFHAAGIKHFVFDLEKMKFINSTGLGMLITVITKARHAGGEAVIINTPDQLEKLIQMTKLTSIFKKAASLEEAKNSF